MDDKVFWSIPFDPDQALAILRRRDELGGGEQAFVQAARELAPEGFMSADDFLADLRTANVLAGAIVGAPAMPEDFE
jgi:hypothetical protein